MVISELFFASLFLLFEVVSKRFWVNKSSWKWINDVQACPSQMIVEIKELHHEEKKKTTLKKVLLSDEVTISDVCEVESR